MAFNVLNKPRTTKAARSGLPPALETECHNLGREQPYGIRDVLTVSANPALAVYLSVLLKRFGWTVSCSATSKNTTDALRSKTTAVVVCEEVLSDGVWQDVAKACIVTPNAPRLVVIGNGSTLLGEVVLRGGCDVLSFPSCEADVIWTIASAWHQWMNRQEAQRNEAHDADIPEVTTSGRRRFAT